MKDGLFDRAFKILLTLVVITFLFLVYFTSESRAYYEQEEDPLLIHLEELAICESENTKITHYFDGGENHSFYWLMFQEPTWEDMKVRYNKSDFKIDNREHQFIIAYLMHTDTRADLAERWEVCNSKLGFI